MAQYPLRELLSLWERGNLTVEQVIGQLILHLLDQEKQLGDLQRRLPKPPPKRQA